MSRASGFLEEICQQDETLQGLRDAALLAILRGARPRRAEVVKLEQRDLEQPTGALTVLRGRAIGSASLPARWGVVFR